ncbi:MAG: hypothetical protein ACE148_16145 [Vicinamibacterales bacterium]
MWKSTSRLHLTARLGPASVLALAAAAVLFAPSSLRAQMGMDARAMSGIPLETGDIASGTVIVRVVRGELSNVVAGHPVTLEVSGQPRTAKTDAEGRAEFAGLAPGASAKASTVLDGVAVESQPFVVPATGGVRMLLVGGAPAGEAGSTPPPSGAAAPGGAAPSGGGGARPAVPGAIVLGGQSRVIVEFDDDVVEVYYLMDFVNGTGTTLTVASPFVVELPAGAQSATVLEGSSPQATVDGRRIRVGGPFAPGTTVVQAAYRMEASGRDLAIEQVFPVPVQQVAFMVQKVPGLEVSSPQATAVREMPADAGQAQAFVTGIGPSLPAGQPLSISLSGVPHQPTWPRNVALALALLVLGTGAWASVRTGGAAGAAAVRRALEARRERAFEGLVALERDYRAGRLSRERYESRRAELVSQLERVYGELDDNVGQADEGRGV